jgi:hypothetical protein
MGRAYQKLEDVDSLELRFKRGRSEILKFGCCDCGLVHRMAFAIEKNGNLGMAVKRDKRATGAARKNLTGLKLPKKQAFNK